MLPVAENTLNVETEQIKIYLIETIGCKTRDSVYKTVKVGLSQMVRYIYTTVKDSGITPQSYC
jgi:hypothetical protein